ncbi:MAG: tRNA (adenosine(37)-N6)-threonylcarbamoyltransferase complex dimerization subunit type 1 TsaB [Caldiserica bacterium]|nr:MAG: tRNA (adenosine(37)-N6)-threonylcarbamoyltransferase complex dimerization subunit type 1 TsaB [Caldisericota bacterium]
MNGLCINNAFSPTMIVFSSEEKLFFSVAENPPSKQPNNILYVVESMMELFSFSPKDIDFISIVKGPGSFTGTRIGVVEGKMLAFLLNIPLVALNSLELIASGFKEEVVPVIPVGRNAYFVSRFNFGKRMEQDLCINLEELLQIEAIIITPVSSLKNVLKEKRVVVHIPTFNEFAKKSFEKFTEGSIVDDPLSLTPIYLRSTNLIFKRKK